MPYSIDELDAATVELLNRQGFSSQPDRLARQRYDGQSNASTSATICETLMNDFNKEVYPAAASAG